MHKLPSPTTDAVKAFAEDLVGNGYSKGTAQVYASRLRTFFALYQTGPTDKNLKAKLDEYVYKEATSAFTTAWRLFAQWCRDSREMDVPMGPGRVSTVPEEAAQALLALRECFPRGNALPPRVLANLCWDMVRVSDGRLVLYDPSGLGGSYVCTYVDARAALRAIHEYAQPKTGASPFFPETGGSNNFLTTRQITLVLQSATRARERLRMQPSDTMHGLAAHDFLQMTPDPRVPDPAPSTPAPVAPWEALEPSAAPAEASGGPRPFSRGPEGPLSAPTLPPSRLPWEH